MVEGRIGGPIGLESVCVVCFRFKGFAWFFLGKSGYFKF